jgi:hypothetical protein
MIPAQWAAEFGEPASVVLTNARENSDDSSLTIQSLKRGLNWVNWGKLIVPLDRLQNRMI